MAWRGRSASTSPARSGSEAGLAAANAAALALGQRIVFQWLAVWRVSLLERLPDDVARPIIVRARGLRGQRFLARFPHVDQHPRGSELEDVVLVVEHRRKHRDVLIGDTALE